MARTRLFNLEPGQYAVGLDLFPEGDLARPRFSEAHDYVYQRTALSAVPTEKPLMGPFCAELTPSGILDFAPLDRDRDIWLPDGEAGDVWYVRLKRLAYDSFILKDHDGLTVEQCSGCAGLCEPAYKESPFALAANSDGVTTLRLVRTRAAPSYMRITWDY